MNQGEEIKKLKAELVSAKIVIEHQRKRINELKDKLFFLSAKDKSVPTLDSELNMEDLSEVSY